MSRLDGTFVEKGTLLSPTQSNVLDASKGGQYGWSSNMPAWINGTPYVSSPLICVLLEAPIGFTKFQNSTQWIKQLKHLFEVRPLRIEGFTSRLDVNVEETDFGGGGKKFHVPTNVTETQPNITFVWNEIYGMGIYRLLRVWINYLIMHPETKYALAGTENYELTDALPDQYSCTAAFIEPDRNHKYVNQAWIVTNMFPKSTGDNNAKRDKASAQEIRELSIEFTGLAQQGDGVIEFAQKLLDSYSIVGANPDKRKSFINDISPLIKDAKTGYGESIGIVKSNQSNYK